MATKRPSTVRRAAKDTSSVVKDRPVLMLVLVPLLGVPAGLATTFLSLTRWSSGAKVVLVLFSVGLGGALLLVVVLFVVKLISARRHQLEDRVGGLEEQMEEQREQLLSLTQQQLGDRDRFIPLYYDLRATVRDASSKIEIAIRTKVLWDRSTVFDTKQWDRNREELSNHPWATEDGIYGPCLEAFGHLNRLTTAGLFRLKRDIKAADNLEGALTALKDADERLTKAIGGARPDQPSTSPP